MRALAGLLLLAGAVAPASGADLVIRNVMIASPERDAAYGPVSVAVTGGRITGIGEKVEGAGQVIEGKGRYLSPGLIDAHTHLMNVVGMRPDQEAANPEVAKAARAQMPRSYLYHGFTTLIDLVAEPGRIQAWNAQAVRPEAYFCGAAPLRDGYPTNFDPAPERYRALPTYLVDEKTTGTLPDGTDANAHSPEAVVERIVGSGAICVKLFYEAGFGGERGLPVPSLELINRVSAAAHARGLKVVLHANSQGAHEVGSNAHVDVLAHGLWNARGEAAPLPQPITEIVTREIKANIAVQPTIQVLYGEAELFDPKFLERPQLAHVTPKSMLAWYGTADGQWFRARMLKEPYWQKAVDSGQWSPAGSVPVKRVRAVLKTFADKGGRLSFGSDTPSGPIYGNPPGLNGRWEMDRWVEAGLAPVQVFRAATQENAAIFGLKDVGTVETGKRADLLLLEGNPFESVTAFDTISTVFVHGVALAREALSARQRN